MSFFALYPDDCENCEIRIEPGDECMMLDWDKKLVAHVRCPDPKPEPKPVSTCGRCGLQHPGEC